MQKGRLIMRKSISTYLFLILFVSLFIAFATPAMADDDPPGRVARLNYMQGSVSFQPGGESDWVQANPNRPLTTGDNLWADRNARGELHIGSTAIRLSSQTGITFLNLDDRTVQIQLAQGSLSVHVRRLDGGDAFEIDTPNLSFTVQRPGEYRVDVDPNGNTTVVTVREGEGDVTGGGSEFHLDSGESGAFSGTDTLFYDGGNVGAPDEFDQWCRSRDDREERAQSAQYVSRDVIGYEDLDEYGDWRNVPDYGYVWFPSRVAAGWAPYRFGHWVWIEPWGWTWVEDEPWGFAPFHYGRWAVFGGGWCWIPGPRVVRPIYAPALVAFVGGPRFGISLTFGGGGGVAWFPLGPREVYVPPYRMSERYMQRVNVTNTTVNVVNVTNIYNNRDVNRVTYMHQNNVGAVTAVSHDTFVNARPVGAAAVRVDPRQLQVAEIQRGASVAPVRQSIVGAGVASMARPSQAVMNREVVVKQTPAAPPVSFQSRQQVLSAQPGSVPTRQQLDQLRGQQGQQQPAGRFAQPGRPFGNQQQTGRAPVQQQPNQVGNPQGQQQPAGKFTPPAQPNANPPQQGRAPMQQQQNQVGNPQVQQQPAGKIIPPDQPSGNQPQTNRVPMQQQSNPGGVSQGQQPPAGKFTPPAQPNVNPPQQGRAPAQQQQNQVGNPQVQQQPAVKTTPPNQPSGNQPQTNRVPTQQQPNQVGNPQGQQPPAGKFTPPAQPNVNPPQQGRAPTQQQQNQVGNPQVQQQPAVKYAPPAAVNQDTYHPHQFERPQNAAPAKPSSEPPKTQDRGKPGGADQEKKQR
jgi:hypothetical protein